MKIIGSSVIWGLLSLAHGVTGTEDHSRNLQNEIVGGSPANLNDYPFFSSLDVGCGGALVYEDIILSAAHCYNGAGGTARVGPSRTSVRMTEQGRHPGYSTSTLKNDFMVIKLATSFDFKLPEINKNSGTPGGTEEIVVMGYGATSQGGSGSNTFLKVTLNHVPHDTCNGPSSYDGDVDQGTMFCAGVDGGGKDR